MNMEAINDIEEVKILNVEPTNVFGIGIINMTPHDAVFMNESGEEVTVPKSGMSAAANAVETCFHIGLNGVEFVKTQFEQTSTGQREIADVQDSYPGTIIVGSIVSAQAYPGVVVSMVPCKGYERVPPDQKRMNPRKFNPFQER